jgi:hypothetical protein
MKKIYLIVFALGVVLGAMAHAAGFDAADPNLANHSVNPGSSSASSMVLGENCPSGACFITANSAQINSRTNPESNADSSKAEQEKATK